MVHWGSARGLGSLGLHPRLVLSIPGSQPPDAKELLGAANQESGGGWGGVGRLAALLQDARAGVRVGGHKGELRLEAVLHGQGRHPALAGGGGVAVGLEGRLNLVQHHRAAPAAGQDFPQHHRVLGFGQFFETGYAGPIIYNLCAIASKAASQPRPVPIEQPGALRAAAGPHHKLRAEEGAAGLGYTRLRRPNFAVEGLAIHQQGLRHGQGTAGAAFGKGQRTPAELHHLGFAVKVRPAFGVLGEQQLNFGGPVGRLTRLGDAAGQGQQDKTQPWFHTPILAALRMYRVLGEPLLNERRVGLDRREKRIKAPYRRALGSRASRRPSPSRLKASTVTMMKRPGKTIVQGALRA